MHVHFIGIGGYGMSALAKVMLEKGMVVSGSDLAEGSFIEKLRAKGATIQIGHAAHQVSGADIVVYSTACSQDNPEIVAARAQGMLVIHRADLLAALLNEQKGIAIAGAHGKTTTSSMTAVVMDGCGLAPTYVIGGEVVNFGDNARAGSSDWVVAEADESDRSFLKYHPQVAVVTNIEADHLENYDGDFAVLLASYRQFLQQVRPGGTAILCVDDPYLRELVQELRAQQTCRVITYGMTSDDADYRVSDLQEADRYLSFSLMHQQQSLGKVELFVPGRHNALNATAALITAMVEGGVDYATAAAALKTFRGAKRRFQVLGEPKDILIVDDYAHHPTEIVATLQAARSTGRRVVAAFQPQRYTRTYFLFDEFSRAFANADEVLITDIYSPAGEQAIEGVNSVALVEAIARNSNQRVRHLATNNEVLAWLHEHAQPGDVVLTMGAGDIWRVAHQFHNDLQ